MIGQEGNAADRKIHVLLILEDNCTNDSAPFFLFDYMVLWGSQSQKEKNWDLIRMVHLHLGDSGLVFMGPFWIGNPSGCLIPLSILGPTKASFRRYGFAWFKIPRWSITSLFLSQNSLHAQSGTSMLWGFSWPWTDEISKAYEGRNSVNRCLR